MSLKERGTIGGMGHKTLRPSRRFRYPEGGGRICPGCRERLPESKDGTEFHVEVSGERACVRLWIAMGRVDGKLVLTEARLL